MNRFGPLSCKECQFAIREEMEKWLCSELEKPSISYDSRYDDPECPKECRACFTWFSWLQGNPLPHDNFQLSKNVERVCINVCPSCGDCPHAKPHMVEKDESCGKGVCDKVNKVSYCDRVKSQSHGPFVYRVRTPPLKAESVV